MFTGMVRHLGLEELMWFVAQQCQFVCTLFPNDVLLVVVVIAPQNNKPGLGETKTKGQNICFV